MILSDGNGNGSCVHRLCVAIVLAKFGELAVLRWEWDAAGISYKNCRQVHNEQYFFIGFFQRQEPLRQLKKIYIFIKISSFGRRTTYIYMHMCETMG